MGIVSTELEPKTDVEIEEETNINEESLSEKESSKKLETDFNFNLEAGSPFEVVAFDPRCLLFQTTVLPQRIPEEVVEVTPDVTLAAILATARTGGSFTDLLLVATGEAKVNRKRERSEEVETFNESKKMKRAEIVFDDVVDIKTEEASSTDDEKLLRSEHFSIEKPTIEEIMFEEELLDKFSDEDDEEEEMKDDEPKQPGFLIFSTLNSDITEEVSDFEDDSDDELEIIEEKSTTIKLKMNSIKKEIEEEVGKLGHVGDGVNQVLSM